MKTWKRNTPKPCWILRPTAVIRRPHQSRFPRVQAQKRASSTHCTGKSRVFGFLPSLFCCAQSFWSRALPTQFPTIRPTIPRTRIPTASLISAINSASNLALLVRRSLTSSSNSSICFLRSAIRESNIPISASFCCCLSCLRASISFSLNSVNWSIAVSLMSFCKSLIASCVSGIDLLAKSVYKSTIFSISLTCSLRSSSPSLAQLARDCNFSWLLIKLP